LLGFPMKSEVKIVYKALSQETAKLHYNWTAFLLLPN
jgi:hypothetical protein